MHCLIEILVNDVGDLSFVYLFLLVVSIAVQTFDDFINVGQIVLEFDLTVDAIIFVFPAAISEELVINWSSRPVGTFQKLEQSVKMRSLDQDLFT